MPHTLTPRRFHFRRYFQEISIRHAIAAFLRFSPRCFIIFFQLDIYAPPLRFTLRRLIDDLSIFASRRFSFHEF